MTQQGIETLSPGPLVNILIMILMSQPKQTVLHSKMDLVSYPAYGEGVG